MVQKKITLRRTGALGDAIACTIVAERLHSVGYTVTFQTHENCRLAVARSPFVSQVEVQPFPHADINLDGAYEKNPQKGSLHFYSMFLDEACRQLGIDRGHFEYLPGTAPILRVNQANRAAFLSSHEGLSRPWFFICPRSDAYAVRTVHDSTWVQVAQRLPGTKFWIGLHPAPQGTHDCRVRQTDLLVDILSSADLLLSTDTGPTQISAGISLPMVVVKQAVDPELRLPPNTFVPVAASLDCLNCQKNVCPKNQYLPPCQNVEPEKIAHAALQLLATRQS